MLRSPAQPRTPRDRLRLAAFGLALLAVTLAAGLHVASPATSPFAHTIGDDLIPSYMAGTFVRTGHAELLTDFDAAAHFQAELRRSADLVQHGRTGPWLNPPFFAWVFVPLSALPYRAALATWATLNLAMLGSAVALVYRMLPTDGRRLGDAAVIAVLLILSMPGLQVLASQQNTCLSLLILCGTVALWRADRPLAAGAVAGLLCFKPQLAMIVWAALAVSAGRRAVGGIALSAGILVGTSLAAMPGAWADYVHKLPALLPYLRTDRPYFWERQVTAIGFWRLLLFGRAGGPTPALVTALWAITAVGVAAMFVRPAWRALRTRVSGIERDRLIAATVAASPLLMPYYMDYDLLLLAVPMTLLAAERMRAANRVNESAGAPPRAGAPSVRALTVAYPAFYVWLYFNATVGTETYLSLSVPLLAIIAAGSALRVLTARDEATRPRQGEEVQHTLPLRAAA